MAVSMGDRIIREIISNHGCKILTFGGSTFASFGDRLTVEVSEIEANVLASWNAEENE
jgi:hypothetical protein